MSARAEARATLAALRRKERATTLYGKGYGTVALRDDAAVRTEALLLLARIGVDEAYWHNVPLPWQIWPALVEASEAHEGGNFRRDDIDGEPDEWYLWLQDAIEKAVETAVRMAAVERREKRRANREMTPR